MIANLEVLVSTFDELARLEDKRGRFYPSKAFKTVSNYLRKGSDLIVESEFLSYVVINGEQVKIGPSSSYIINELINTGSCQRLIEYRQELKDVLEKEDAIDELCMINGIGPVKAEKIYDSIKIKSLSELYSIMPEVGEYIPGTDVRFTNQMRVGVRIQQVVGNRRLLWNDAHNLIEDIKKYLQSWFSGLKIEIIPCGSYRRNKPDVGDIDIILVIDESSLDFIDHIRNHVELMYQEVLVNGDKKISGFINNFQVDIRYINKKERGAHLLHATGSAEFNQRLRSIVKSRGMKLNEYCITRKNGQELYFESEEDIFKFLRIKFIAPKDR